MVAIRDVLVRGIGMMNAKTTHDMLSKKISEDLVVSKFFNEGYVILERNYRSPHGEIDLICEKNDIIYFINVSVTDCIKDTTIHNNTDRDDVRKVAEDFMMENYHELKEPFEFKNIDVRISETECM